MALPEIKGISSRCFRLAGSRIVAIRFYASGLEIKKRARNKLK
jgi:hypothetical protein